MPMKLEEYQKWHWIPADIELELLELVARAMVGAYNGVLDAHVRPCTYEELRDDPRHGTIHAAAAAIAAVRKFDQKVHS